MLIETLKSLFERDLNKLKVEIGLYTTDSNLWLTEKGIANSAGNLSLHLVGNLNTFIGAAIGNTGYVRNRALEFSAKDIPMSELVQMIEDTTAVVASSLDKLNETSLSEEFPILVFDKKTTIEFMLVHLATHLAYHLGQVNYHRRLIDIN